MDAPKDDNEYQDICRVANAVAGPLIESARNHTLVLTFRCPLFWDGLRLSKFWVVQTTTN